MEISIATETNPAFRRQIVEDLTARLPQWFGRPDSNRHYAQQAELLEAWAARLGRRPVGLVLIKRHSPASAEIYWLGVDPDHHRQGIGRALIDKAEQRLKQETVEFLFVMTLHPDDPYEPYQRTRAFYESIGFQFALSIASTPDPLAYYLKLL
jgi:ribosomal protein S18 acetylase RimI-like enzyme